MDAFETKVKPVGNSTLNTTSEDSNDDPKCKREQLIRDFSGYTTLHGFHFLLDSISWTRRLFWLTLMVTMLTLFVIQFVQSYRKLYANESTLTKGVEKARQVQFPAITICNQNMMRKSQILGTEAQRYLDQLDTIKRRLEGIKDSNESLDIEKLVREKGHKLGGMMWDCSYRETKCTPQNFSIFTSETRGLCYTFNSGKDGAPAIYITSPGMRQRFSIQLDAQPEEYYGPYSYMATGFKVAVHDQNEFPDMDQGAFDLSPGFLTNIRVVRQKETSLPAPYASNCSSKTLSNFSAYSVSACVKECVDRILADTCKCLVLGMAIISANNTRFCSTFELNKCVHNTASALNPSTDCDCPKPCKAINYKLQLSTAYFPSESLWDTILPVLSKPSSPFHYMNTTGMSQNEVSRRVQEVVRKRICVANIFFETLVTDVLEEKAAYGISEFGSDLGGNMGLFLGCSVLTVCEFADLIIMLFIFGWRKGKQKVVTLTERERKQTQAET